MRFLVTVALLLTAPLALAERRGGIAFHYATPLGAFELDWYSQYDVLVTHDPLPRAQVDELHRRGTKLVLYEWAVAYYATLATPWHRAAPVLNTTPLRGHLGAPNADAFYFDPASRGHEQGRAEFLARRLAAIGYDGVFFDTTTAESVHPDALAEYRRRHPDLAYDEAFAMFLANLRPKVKVMVTNQGYRAAPHVLPYVDWDVSESLMTFPRNGQYVMRPWNDPNDQWNSTAHLMKQLIAPAQRKFPRVRFAHINYLDAIDRTRIARLVAVSRLYDAEPVVARPDLAVLIADDLMLLDLGAPQKRVDRATGAYRFYARGFIAYNAGNEPMHIANRGRHLYDDAIKGGQVSGRTIVVPPGRAVILRRAQ